VRSEKGKKKKKEPRNVEAFAKILPSTNFPKLGRQRRGRKEKALPFKQDGDSFHSFCNCPLSSMGGEGGGEKKELRCCSTIAPSKAFTSARGGKRKSGIKTGRRPAWPFLFSALEGPAKEKRGAGQAQKKGLRAGGPASLCVKTGGGGREGRGARRGCLRPRAHPAGRKGGSSGAGARLELCS